MAASPVKKSDLVRLSLEQSAMITRLESQVNELERWVNEKVEINQQLFALLKEAQQDYLKLAAINLPSPPYKEKAVAPLVLLKFPS